MSYALSVYNEGNVTAPLLPHKKVVTEWNYTFRSNVGLDGIKCFGTAALNGPPFAAYIMKLSLLSNILHTCSSCIVSPPDIPTNNTVSCRHSLRYLFLKYSLFDIHLNLIRTFYSVFHKYCLHCDYLSVLCSFVGRILLSSCYTTQWLSHVHFTSWINHPLR
jgi:hypothetical protein